MPSSDGKSYLTDVADSDSMIEIVNTISSKYTNQLELYFEKIETTYPHSKEISLKNLEEVEDIELPLDLYQDDSNIIIESLVAGSQIEDIFISVNYKNVTIKGKRIIPQEKQNYLLQEIYWGVFSRNILLPAEIQIDKVEATISHGFLTIKLPKIDTKRNRIIKIKSI
jgi:HSP20 family protein